MREKTEQQAAPMGEIGAEEKEDGWGGREGEREEGGGRAVLGGRLRGGIVRCWAHGCTGDVSSGIR